MRRVKRAMERLGRIGAVVEGGLVRLKVELLNLGLGCGL